VPNEPRSERRAVRGGLLQVQLTWAGQGRPLLYLHGIWGALGGWEQGGFLRLLAERYLVLAPSHPGFDSAERTDAIDNPLDLAMHYIDLLEELMIESPFLVGVGLGGLVAAEMASLVPRDFAKVVLIAPLGLSETQPAIDLLLDPQFDPAELLWFDRGVARSSAAEHDGGVQEQLNLAAAAQLGPERSTVGKRLHRLVAPTLLVRGGADRLVPFSTLEALKGRVRNSVVAVIPSAAHLVHLEQPSSVARTVLGFLED
jgi:pimeloyl-ACP methyl ester carboxylesterase